MKPKPETVDWGAKNYGKLSEDDKKIINGAISALLAKAAMETKKVSA